MNKVLLISTLYYSTIFSTTEVFFSQSYTDNKDQAYSSNLTEKLISLISSAKQRIYIAIYMLTDAKIATAITNAKKNLPNLDIQILVDDALVQSPFGKTDFLVNNNISVYAYDFSKFQQAKLKNTKINDNSLKHPKKKSVSKFTKIKPIMHNKYAIIDNCVWTGSFNFTVNANRNNHENVLVTTNKKVVSHYQDNFQNLKRHANLIIPHKLASQKTTPKSSEPTTKTPTFEYIKAIVNDFEHFLRKMLFPGP